MMGVHEGQKELFSYGVDLDRRVRVDHPLRRVLAAVDFRFVREETAQFYGYNGNVSVDPALVMKLMFLLFFDDVKSERELMRILPERLDYLWFLGLSLEDEIPDHSVLSKARARWGQEVFERLFVRTVGQCVEAGLVDGAKLHMDGSLIAANASRDSVVKASPELIKALKEAYQVQVQKLEENRTNPGYEAVNDSLCSTTDPDAPCVRQKGTQGAARPRYKQHRAIDDKCGVITSVITTPGDVPEPDKVVALIEQHEANTGAKTQTLVADKQYGTVATYRQLQTRGIRAHIAPMEKELSSQGIFPRSSFTYEASEDLYRCPANQLLYPRRLNARRQATEYTTRKGVCDQCELRAKCTRSKTGRTLMRHVGHDQLMQAQAEGLSRAAKRDRRRRQYLMEGSFAQAANLHHFKRARWRRLWRQQIQDWLIAAAQNIKTLLGAIRPSPNAVCDLATKPALNDRSTPVSLFECYRNYRIFFP
jgi:transposase